MRLPFSRRPIHPEYFEWGICPVCSGALSPEEPGVIYCPTCGRVWEKEE